MKFAVIGGDLRQAKLCDFLAGDGHSVTSFALDKATLMRAVRKSPSAKEAVTEADCVILPLPALLRDDVLNAPFAAWEYRIGEVLPFLRQDQLVCAGRVPPELIEEAARTGIRLIDYFEREELTVANAVATVEGALQLAIEETSITLCRAKCLVTGFGRIGKLLCHRLRGLGASVTAASRSCEDLAWVAAYGYDPEPISGIDARLREYDLVINTIPARVLGKTRLALLKPGCLCIDLASKPGGVDFEAAARLDVKALWALSLPGKVAPVTSGAMIRDTIYNILREQGVKI